MPAAFLWDPVHADPGDERYYADVPGNWWRTDLPELTRWNRVPDDRDELYFVGTVSVESCVIPDQTPAAPSLAFAGIHLLFGHYPTSPPGDGVPVPPPPPVAYSGTVTVEDSFAVGVLEVECGQVEQADPDWLTPPVPYAPHAGTLTITSTLNWTGGTLNSNNRPGYIDLAPGATGVAEPSFTNPGINGTVTLGSELRLRGDEVSEVGSALTLNNGTYTLIGGMFHAMAYSILVKAPVPKPIPNDGKPSIFVDNQKWEKPTVQVDQGAVARVTSDGRANSTNPVEVKLKGGATQYLNRGSTTIESYTHVILEKGGALGAEYTQNKGGGALPATTKLQAGSAIIAKDPPPANGANVHIQEGELQFYSVPGIANQPEALIEGPVNNNAVRPWTLKVNIGATVTTPLLSDYVKLKVNGDVLCEGNLQLWADRTGVKHDSIVAQGIFTLRTPPTPTTLTVFWRNPGAALAAVTTKWYYLESLDAARGGIANFPNSTWPVESLPVVLGTVNDGTSKFGMERTA